MADYATRIKGGKVYVRGDLVETDVLIDDGKIVGRPRSGDNADALEVIDATGKLVLPGIIDTHAHTHNLATHTRRTSTLRRQPPQWAASPR